MQSIYESNLQNDLISYENTLPIFEKKMERTQALYVTTLHLMHQIAMYVLIYANQRASKLLATQDDLQVNTKIAQNILLQQLAQNEAFNTLVKKYKITHLFDEEFIKSLFLVFVQTPEYIEYTKSKERTALEEKKILEVILNQCIYSNEDTAAHLSSIYMNWYTDYDMIHTWNEKLLYNIHQFPFNKMASDEKITYSKDLLKCYFDKKNIVLDLIIPKLNNWDPERIAILDMIILHLGICELLYFDTIPVKVSINEYIDIAKAYSTPQSGQFVNGLLDNVRKELESKNMIHKTQSLKNK